jgi:hypothetical protein
MASRYVAVREYLIAVFLSTSLGNFLSLSAYAGGAEELTDPREIILFGTDGRIRSPLVHTRNPDPFIRRESY